MTLSTALLEELFALFIVASGMLLPLPLLLLPDSFFLPSAIREHLRATDYCSELACYVNYLGSFKQESLLFSFDKVQQLEESHRENPRD